MIPAGYAARVRIHRDVLRQILKFPDGIEVVRVDMQPEQFVNGPVFVTVRAVDPKRPHNLPAVVDGGLLPEVRAVYEALAVGDGRETVVFRGFE